MSAPVRPLLRSLQARLTAASLVAWGASIVVLAIALNNAFQASLDRGAAAQQRLLISMLLSATELEGGVPAVQGVLREPAFAQPGSGTYGFLLGPGGQIHWRSESVLGAPEVERLPGPEWLLAPAQARAGVLGDHYARALGVAFEDEFDASLQVPATVLVLSSRGPFRTERQAFSTTLFLWLGGAAVVLLALQALLLRQGLTPVRAMAADVARIERGEASRLEGDYPAELERLADNLNLLVSHEAHQREAYRNALGNLAHTLKTPLAVLRSALESDTIDTDGRTLMAAQVERMDQLVRLQLRRAAPAASPLRTWLDLQAPIDGVLEAVARAHHGVPLTFTRTLDVSAWPLDEGDFYEVLGNLVENAAKYGGGRIHVATRRHEDQLELRVEDDGPGIPEAQREEIFQRGLRLLDTMDPHAAVNGQGLGLSIVRERLAAYGGNIRVERSALGGAAFVARF